MIILRGSDIKMPTPCALAMGKFESIHLGHQGLISQMKRSAHGLPTALLVFSPNPYKVLHDPAYNPLFTDDERGYLVARQGVDYLLEYPFDAKLANLSPKDFCNKIYNDLQARIVVVGEGYHFGQGRTGTADTLRKSAKAYGATVCEVAHIGEGETLLAQDYPNTTSQTLSNDTTYADPQNTFSKASTSTIRTLLADGKTKEAQQLLGFPYFVMGQVTPGLKLGRTIGFPTLNLYPPQDSIHGKFLPPDGVYATRTVIMSGKKQYPGNQARDNATHTNNIVYTDETTYQSITNIGLRPTIYGTTKTRSVETHLLEYNQEPAGSPIHNKNHDGRQSYNEELYGKQIRVEFSRFIRPEQRFESLEALREQILIDIQGANIWL